MLFFMSIIAVVSNRLIFIAPILSENYIFERLDSIPGVGKTTAQSIIAEIGTNMDQFPSAKHLASWVGICPGQNESDWTICGANGSESHITTRVRIPNPDELHAVSLV
jgi:hypothetical protein